MRAILVLTPYILVPLLMTLFFKWFRFSWKSLTYLITAIIILNFPFWLFWLDNYLNPPSPGLTCGNPQMIFVFANIIIFLPIVFLLQFVFNKTLLNIKNKNVLIDSSKNKSSLNTEYGKDK
jgi:hypothetical protein